MDGLLVPIGETPYSEFGTLDLKLASVLIYGEDIRPRVPLPPIDIYGRVLMHAQLRFIGRVRGNPQVLVFPLDYPDLDGAFYGYDQSKNKGRDGVIHATTKDMVRITGGLASALTTWKGRRFVARKGDCVAAYRETINDEWTELIATIDRACRVEWGYLVPDDPEGRCRLRDLCARVLRFENHFLADYRDFALEELAGRPNGEAWLAESVAAHLLDYPPSGVRERVTTGELRSREKEGRLLVEAEPCLRVYAARMLGRVRYGDDRRIEDALAILTEAGSPDLREAAQQCLKGLKAAP